MDENEGKNLENSMKEYLLSEIKRIETELEKEDKKINMQVYEDVPLDTDVGTLVGVGVLEKDEFIKNEKNDVEQRVVTYNLYLDFGQDGVQQIGTIDAEGNLTITNEKLKELIPEGSKGEVSHIQNMKGKQKEELEEELSKDKEEGKTNDEIEEDKKDEKDSNDDNGEEKEPEEGNEDLDKEIIAKEKHVSPNNVFAIRRDSQFYKNHLNVPKTTYFYKDNDGVFRAEYINEKGETEPCDFFNDSTTHLQENVVSLGDNGNPVKETVPYQVMTTNGLNTQGSDVRDVRIAIYVSQTGIIEIEEIRQGRDGKWAGVGNIETQGRDYNDYDVNELSDARTSDSTPDDIVKDYELIEESDLGADGVQIDELDSEKIIEQFIDEGYQRKEAEKIYGLIVGSRQLTEEQAKQEVNEEIAKEQKDNERDNESDSYEKVPWPTY